MALSMAKLVDLKRKKWQSKLRNTKRQVLHRCLAIFGRVSSFRRKQERNGKCPRCSEARRAIVVQPTSGDLPEDLVEEIRKKQERSGENPSYSVTTLAIEIPDDIVEEILVRLPVHYLVRLKSVSKKWKSLIESGNLAEKHTLLSQKKYGATKITVELSKSGTFHTRYFTNGSELGAHIRESKDVLRVPGSCNGLVCVYDLVYVYLFNPLTRVIRTLTPPRGTKVALTPPGGTCTELSVGFGRDVVTGSYKVVGLYRFGDNRVKSKVFDLSTNKWRRRYKTAGPVPLSFTLISLERNPVFVNGSLFWLLARHHSEILVMDLHTEKFRTVSLPNDIAVSLGRIYMWSLKDRLCVSDLRQRLDSDVWVLVQDDVTERWERTRFPLFDDNIPPLTLNSSWFSESMVSPYQSSSSCRQRHNISVP